MPTRIRPMPITRPAAALVALLLLTAMPAAAQADPPQDPQERPGARPAGNTPEEGEAKEGGKPRRQPRRRKQARTQEPARDPSAPEDLIQLATPLSPEETILRFDRDGDGSLGAAELRLATLDREQREARRARLIAVYDGNQNGKLDPHEGKKALAEDARRREEADLVTFDKNKNGRLDPAELQARDEANRPAPTEPNRTPAELAASTPEEYRDALLERFDKNQDGELQPLESRLLKRHLNAVQAWEQYQEEQARGEAQPAGDDPTAEDEPETARRRFQRQPRQRHDLTPAQRRGLFQRFDSDQDGALSAEEREALNAHLQAERKAAEERAQRQREKRANGAGGRRGKPKPDPEGSSGGQR